MGYDRADSFPFNFEPNGIPFGSKSKCKLLARSYPIEFERKWKFSFLSVSLIRIVFPLLNILTKLLKPIVQAHRNL